MTNFVLQTSFSTLKVQEQIDIKRLTNQVYSHLQIVFVFLYVARETDDMSRAKGRLNYWQKKRCMHYDYSAFADRNVVTTPLMFDSVSMQVPLQWTLKLYSTLINVSANFHIDSSRGHKDIWCNVRKLRREDFHRGKVLTGLPSQAVSGSSFNGCRETFF